MGAYPRRRLRLGRVAVFVGCLVLVLVYVLSLKPPDPEPDPVHLKVRDLDQDLNPDLNQDTEEEEEEDEDEFEAGVQDLNQDLVIPVNRTDIETCIYVDKTEPTVSPPQTNPTRGKNEQRTRQSPVAGAARDPALAGTVTLKSGNTGQCMCSPPAAPPPKSASGEIWSVKGEYPVDLFSLQQRRRGWIILHVFGMIYMFVALAIVCDEFFVPALEVITEKLQISEDVAGATFMAAGGSAPELFTSLIGVFIAHSNIGIGTIVGSAVFNILFVIGMCAIFSREMLHLTWWPLFRDVTFYILDLSMLIVFFLDNAIRWWESAMLVSAYICYVVFMKFNSQIEKAVKSGCRKHKGTVQVWSADEPDKVTEAPPPAQAPPPAAPLPAPPLLRPLLLIQTPNPKPTRTGPRHRESKETHLRPTDGPDQNQGEETSRPLLQRGGSTVSLHNASMRNTIFQLMIHTLDPLTEDGEQKPQSELPGAEPSTSQKLTEKTLEKATEPQYETKIPEETEPSSCSSSSSSCSSCAAAEDEEKDGEEDAEAEEEEEESAPLSLDWPQTWSKQVSYLLLLPIVFPLYVTVPDVRNAASRRFFPMTFLGSILWIGVFSYLMVWWAHQVGETVGISEEIMGLTILAAGTSIPDLITSVIVARKGLGDMAVSSSVGSNIFDITVGLPVPGSSTLCSTAESLWRSALTVCSVPSSCCSSCFSSSSPPSPPVTGR
ncbi:hypothetical protein WMY93_012562 [Mugilogobius chulae]|uniref:Sodium/potassium/calcium exchanger 1 n=1 Tax=Mugilogobius chulae TaxID=88201 RepID=A0AAW0NXE6_9GOBI